MNPLVVLAFGIAVVVGSILVLRIHAFLALILGALLVASLTTAPQLEAYARSRKMSEKETQSLANSSVGIRVTKEFGNACGRIGILIALASIVGKCLMDSGAADRIVRSITGVLGERHAPLGFLISGYVLGIPIFFDTVFLLMVPLCKAMWMRTRKRYTLYILAVIAGGSMTHSLVPPTPGPLMVAGELKVDIGIMILMGCFVGALTAFIGLLYAYWIDHRLQIPVRDTEQALAELEAVSRRDERELPPLWMALAPVLMPVLFIGATTLVEMLWKPAQINALSAQAQQIIAVIKWLGDPNIALTVATALAMIMLIYIKRPGTKQLTAAMNESLADGGQILLLTAAGGAFGGMLQQTGVGAEIQSFIAGKSGAVLPIAFLVTVLVRAAQGSATVAMITAVGMFASIATPEQLGFHPVYLAIAIGCGSKPLAWMNDSGFWVIGKMSGMTESETLKTFSAQTSIEGLAGLLITMLLSKVLPMAG
ncbi:MAG TPA: SLC13 family permease [Planctomycetota bacterium]|nr:SLC13 family permease [Planctomycetota bacterium]